MRLGKKSKTFWKQKELTTIQNLWDPVKAVLKREVHNDTGLPKKERNISNKQPNPTCIRTGGTTTKPRVSRRKEITKIRAELNDIETKRTTQRISKYRSWFCEKINKTDKPLSKREKERDRERETERERQRERDRTK